MARYIDVEKINFKGADRYFDENNDTLVSLGEVMQIIKSTPAADVVEVVHGFWEQGDYYDMGDVCSECGYDSFREPCNYNYCPHCGAKIDGKDGE